MYLEDFVKIAQIFGYVAAGGSFIFAALTYRKNNIVKRGEWLKSLFEKFFEQKDFAVIRREIEYNRLKSFLNLNDIGDAANEANEEELVNYLNFFEFIAMLRNSNQLKLDDVNKMFGYYLKSINQNIFLKEYLNKYDFENLVELLKNYE